jgi:hypothetical protein
MCSPRRFFPTGQGKVKTMNDFERTRLDIAGKGVTITSWFEPDKHRWRANAPAFLHLMNSENGDGSETVISGTTRAQAIRAVCDHLSKRIVGRTAARY